MMKFLIIPTLAFVLMLSPFVATEVRADGAGDIMSPADYPFGTIAGGIANTRHNLGTTGRVLHTDPTGGPADIEGRSEICIFCHTPHHGSTNAPLWNKGIQTTTYTTYGTTLGGNQADAQPGAASLACLSCHDGVNTFDSLINWPGKGTFGDNINPAVTDMGWIFDMPDGSGAETLDHFNSATPGTCTLCHNSVANGGIIPVANPQGNPSYSLEIGTNLANDHPVSIVYNDSTTANWGGSLRDSTTVISTITMDNNVLTTGDDTGSDQFTANRWAVAGYINADASISEILRNGKVECSSCHDPHFDNMSWDEVEAEWADDGQLTGGTTWCDSGEDCGDGLFLRRVGGNSLSGVCRTCHAK